MSKKIRMIYSINRSIIKKMSKNRSRSIKITGVGYMGNFLADIRKLMMGIISLSFFIYASTFYTFGIAKACILKELVKEKREQYQYYKLSDMILIVTSVRYVILL